MYITDSLKRDVWAKGQIVDGFDPAMYRKDACGAWIVWDKYGASDNIYGWQIDHIYPVSRLEQRGFSEEEIWNIKNLRPLQSMNNLSKADDYPSYTAIITSDGNKNIQMEKNLIVNVNVREQLKVLYQI